MAEQQVNGWNNAVTFYVASEVVDFEGYDDVARECRRRGKENMAHFGITVKYPGLSLLADAIKEDIEEYATGEVDGVGLELIQFALADVNWHEIAEHIMQDLPDDDSDEGWVTDAEEYQESLEAGEDYA